MDNSDIFDVGKFCSTDPVLSAYYSPFQATFMDILNPSQSVLTRFSSSD